MKCVLVHGIFNNQLGDLNYMGNNMKIQPVILCGGKGTRLWPLSRDGFPKQFLCLQGDKSLFQQSVGRLMDLNASNIEVSPPIIVTGDEHRFLVIEQLREIGIGCRAILLEPVGRNTAPALTLAAMSTMELDEDPVLVVIPADQDIADQAAFVRALHTAIHAAPEHGIVILGIEPNRIETGYGYIKAQRQAKDDIRSVQLFVEKPNAEKAQQFLTEGDYYWNAGMFVLKASVWLQVLKDLRPDVFESTRQAWEKRVTDSFSSLSLVRPDKEKFMEIPSVSIDYAVMERCSENTITVKMVPLDAGWSDLGSWDSVWNELDRDDQGNAFFGDVLTFNSHNSMVHAANRLVSLVGVSNLVVVETHDAVLVADKSSSQNVKNIVQQLQTAHRTEYASHRKTHRPWGWYDIIDEGEYFKVKHIQVNPNASLSLQKHEHRAEHWVVVNGTAEVTVGDKVFTLMENQSTYIPVGEIHRLINRNSVPLEIIEVQTGRYLGEDDIIRIEDGYGR